MKLITDEIELKLIKAGYRNMQPICKLFTPWGGMTWLLTGKENGIYYGYADLMMGVVEWGSLFTRDEILAVEGPFGLKVERDLHFKADPDAKYLNMVSLAGI